MPDPHLDQLVRLPWGMAAALLGSPRHDPICLRRHSMCWCRGGSLYSQHAAYDMRHATHSVQMCCGPGVPGALAAARSAAPGKADRAQNSCTCASARPHGSHGQRPRQILTYLMPIKRASHATLTQPDTPPCCHAPTPHISLLGPVTPWQAHIAGTPTTLPAGPTPRAWAHSHLPGAS